MIKEAAVFLLCLSTSAALAASPEEEESTPRTVTDLEIPAVAVPIVIPDLSEAPAKVSAQGRNWFAVPIPFSNPTLDSGLVLAGAYFHPQTEAEKSTQPPSVTGAGVMYSGNGSWGVGIGHALYSDEDRWRFVGGVGYADVDLPLLRLGSNSEVLDVEWLLSGYLAFGALSRRIGGHWYAGLTGVYTEIEQDLAIDILSIGFDLRSSFQSVGLGPSLAYDTRDVPSNPYTGRYIKVGVLIHRPSLGSDLDYDAYSVAFKSYHELTKSLVLAWELGGCARSDGVPLWDACRIGLRGFASTQYMGRSSVKGQAEARLRLSKRWGVVAFAGAGKLTKTFTGLREGDVVPSYGAGVRFSVQPAQRVNMSLDYARSEDDQAVYLSVGEAF